MPVHDWTQVEAGIYHDFHVGWIPGIRSALNEGLLPPGFYALAEQHAGLTIADILTLHASPADTRSSPEPGGIAVADAPPRVRRKQLVSPAGLRRSIAIRHVSGHRLVALIEIVSPANKDRSASVEKFATKAADALAVGVNLLVIDLFPTGSFDPEGMYGAIRDLMGIREASDEEPTHEPLALSSFVAGSEKDIYVEYLSVGDTLIDMPLFLDCDHCVNVPLETTYQAAYSGMPEFWREVIEGQRQVTS